MRMLRIKRVRSEEKHPKAHFLAGKRTGGTDQRGESIVIEKIQSRPIAAVISLSPVQIAYLAYKFLNKR